MEYKQVILVREDLNLPKGKMAAQVGHACVESAMKADKKIVSEWRQNGAKKVVLKIENEKALFEMKQQLDQVGLVSAVITDAGKTIIAPGTVTCIGIGPDQEEIVDKITGHLSTY